MDEQLMHYSGSSEHTSQETSIKIVTQSEGNPVVTEAIDIVVQEAELERLSTT